MKKEMSMQRWIDQFSRFFVGSLFIFSGLIKLNDPVGTEIKMEEYFDVFSQDFGSFFGFFSGWALEIAMVMILLEITLGVAILIYYRMAITTWVLLLLMVFFTFLTFYSAAFNKVTDCGCFGDAIKLTPWQSFTKDIILMVFVLHLFWYRRRYAAILPPMQGLAVVAGTLLMSFVLGIYAIRHLPFIDFRAYAIGRNIPAEMVAPEQPVIEYIFTKDGEEVRSMKFLQEAEGYKYVSSRVINEDRIKPKITDYSVHGADDEDLTQSTFQGPRLFVIIANVKKASSSNIEAIRNLVKGLDGKVECLILTSSGAAEIDAFRHEHQLAVPFAFTDATVLKTIIRSNPGIALWKNGTVLGNWHFNDAPTAEEVLNLISGK